MEEVGVRTDWGVLLRAVGSYYASRYELLGEGRNRATYRVSADWVVKVPRCEAGIFDNESESETYGCLGGNLAACSVFYEEGGIPVLFMEYVEPVCLGASAPSWVSFVDCGQVGYTRAGKLVAYDYGRY